MHLVYWRVEPRRRHRRIFSFQAVRVLCGELQVEEREDLLKWGRAPSEAMFCRAAIAATVTILNVMLEP